MAPGEETTEDAAATTTLPQENSRRATPTRGRDNTQERATLERATLGRRDAQTAAVLGRRQEPGLRNRDRDDLLCGSRDRSPPVS